MSEGYDTLSGSGVTAFLSNDGRYHFIQMGGVKYRIVDELQVEYFNRLESQLAKKDEQLKVAIEALKQIERHELNRYVECPEKREESQVFCVSFDALKELESAKHSIK